MFIHDFHAEPDVSYILSEIICYKDIIPTGSPLSQSIAFWSHRRLFEIIDRISKERNIEFTLYVDDMIFSSRAEIPISFVGRLKKILANHSLEIKNKKTVHYYGNDYKSVTGCIVTPRNELRVSNRHKKRTISLLGSLDEPKKLKSLEGLISYCQAIEPTIFDQTKKRLKNTNICI